MIKTTPPAILFWFCIYLFATGVVGLMCYNCASTKAFSECESDVAELKKGVHSKFAVNCSAYANLTHSYCSIETHRANGQVKAIIRECGDGEFSFKTTTPGFSKMRHLNGRTNVTICSYVDNTMVCASLCNASDMCNYLPSSADTGSLKRSASAILFLVWLDVYLLPIIK